MPTAKTKTQPGSDSLLTIPEAAKRLSVNRTSVYDYFADGRLTPHDIGKPGGKPHMRVSENELNAYIRSCARPVPTGRKHS